MRDFYARFVKPYRKAYAAAICGGIMVASQHYDVGWLQVASAVVSPFAVYFARNET